jgi:hypothetical protein
MGALKHSAQTPCGIPNLLSANWWPVGSGVMRRPLVPLPNRPNPTDPGDAADLSIP